MVFFKTVSLFFNFLEPAKWRQNRVTEEALCYFVKGRRRWRKKIGMQVFWDDMGFFIIIWVFYVILLNKFASLQIAKFIHF